MQVEYKKTLTEQDFNKALKSRPMPAAPQLEEAVLGAIMLNKDAMSIVRDILKPKDFYNPAHVDIYKAMQALDERGNPIDLLTVTEELRKKGRLKEVGGGYYIVDLTNRVGSSANIEYHSRIIYQKSLSREGIKEMILRLNDLYDDRKDVFDVRNKIADKLRVQLPHGFFETTDINKVIEEGNNLPEQKRLLGSLMHEGEVCFMFGPPATGKSIFGYQAANAISKGMDFIPNVLVNDCDPMKVLYIDFELTARNLSNRYKDYKFNSEMFIRASINADFIDYEQRLDKLAQTQIEQLILLHDAKVIIVDNITFLTAESSQDTNVAIALMKKLVSYKRRHNLSMLIMAHTSKSFSKFLPLEQKDMAGSAHLANFADSQFGIKVSAKESTIKYIKQFKSRNAQMHYDEENVIVCETTMTSQNYEEAFLCFDFIKHEREQAHLAVPDNEVNLAELIETACDLMSKNPKDSYAKIMEKIGWDKTKNTLRNKMQKFASEHKDYKVEDGKIRYNLQDPF